jgi:surface polysaccharide O-acyltransferase-like enzyme
MTTGDKAEFLPYIHDFRAVAIVAVVASHLDLVWPQQSFEGHVVNSLAQNGSAMFLFVAGFLFQHLSARFSYRRYLESKLKNVLVPYVVVSLPMLVYQYVRRVVAFAPDHPGLHFGNPLLQGLWALATADHMPAPMWFVPMISVFYLAAPLLIRLDRSPRGYWIIPPLLLVAMLCHRPLPVNRIGQALVYFTPAYLTGMWFSHYRAPVMRVVDANLGKLFATFAAVEVFCLVVLHRPGALFSHAPFTLEGGWLDLNLPNKLLLSFALTGLLARYRRDIGGKLDYLAGASFGVFFVHEYVVQLTQRVFLRLQHHDIEGSVPTALVLLPFYTLASLALVVLARRLLGKNSRYVVGC